MITSNLIMLFNLLLAYF